MYHITVIKPPSERFYYRNHTQQALGSSVSEMVGRQTRCGPESHQGRVLKDHLAEASTYLSFEFSNRRTWFPFLVTHGSWTLPIPVLKFLNASQVKQGFEASAVVLDHSEILILYSTAYLEKKEQPIVKPRANSPNGLPFHLFNKIYFMC